jgi:multidrug efflux pump subunit AcrA (membrane-fusion protein)
LAEVLVVPGQAVNAGDPLVRLVKTAPVWVEVALRPSDAAAVNSDPVGIHLLPSGAQTAVTLQMEDIRLVSRSPEVDRRTGAVTTIIEVRSGLGSVPLGTSAEAEILLAGEIEGIVVPASAVIDDGGVPIVYVQLEGESFARQEVQVRARQGTSILVDGLEPGLRLVTRGGAAIRRAALVNAGAGEGHVH